MVISAGVCFSGLGLSFPRVEGGSSLPLEPGSELWMETLHCSASARPTALSCLWLWGSHWTGPSLLGWPWVLLSPLGECDVLFL